MEIVRTAKAVTLGRALAHLRGATGDSFAEVCLPPFTAFCLRRYANRQWFPMRGLPEVVIAEIADDMMGPRTQFIDEGLARLRRGFQCVILGAGYDSRAHRLEALSQSSVFEVDLPEIQREKKALAQSWPMVANALTYVSCDLTEGHLTERLLEAGFSSSLPTAWILDGLITYLPQHQVNHRLEEINALSATHSKIWLTYNEDGFFRQLISMQTARHGEPHRFWSSPGDMEKRMHTMGFRVEADVDGLQRAKWYRTTTVVDWVWTRLHHILVATK